MAKSRSRTYRRLTVIARDVLLTNPTAAEPDLTEIIKTAASRAHLPYTTESVWKAMNAVRSAYGWSPTSVRPPTERITTERVGAEAGRDGGIGKHGECCLRGHQRTPKSNPRLAAQWLRQLERRRVTESGRSR